MSKADIAQATVPEVRTEPVDHHDPLGRRDYLSIEHLERYRFACRNLEGGLRVLDLACGAGYGTAMLAVHGLSAVGVDCDERTVAIARDSFPSGEFECADARSLPFADSTFDAVVTFETIEHVPDGAGYLREMMRVLRPGGTLICSTPNIGYTAHPEFHVKEYRPSEFFELVEGLFGGCERFGQYFGRRERMVDLYRWHVKPHLLGAADAVGLRPLVRRLRGGKPSASATTAIDPATRMQSLRAWLSTPEHRDHGVRRHVGDRLLRIMVAIARKAEACAVRSEG